MNRLRASPRPRDRVSEIVATGFAYPRMIVDNDGFFARCRRGDERGRRDLSLLKCAVEGTMTAAPP